MEIRKDVSLKPFNTFGIDVRCSHFVQIDSDEALEALLAESVFLSQPKIILGGGSNVLFRKDVHALVVKNEITGIAVVREDDNHYWVRAGAGENWHGVVLHCIRMGYAGIENLALIPGCVGASPMQNIGAYGVEIKDVFDSLEAVQIPDGSKRTFTRDECDFGYRESVFKRGEKDRWIITHVTLRLNKRPVFHIEYGAIEEELEKINSDRLSIKDVAQAVINIRSSKLPNPAVLGNAGSFFKNPVVAMDLCESLRAAYPEMPAYPVSGSEVKLAAGWLIEQTGWKGRRIGSCGVHDRQALVLVNYGGATGDEIYALSERVAGDVQERFGVTLEREVNLF